MPNIINISFAGIFNGYSKNYVATIETQQNGKVYFWEGIFINGVLSSLTAYKNTALTELNAHLANNEYLDFKYTTENWATLQQILNDGKIAINSAYNVAGVDNALKTTKDNLDKVPQKTGIDVQIETAKFNLTNAYNDYLQTDYTSDNWTIIKAYYDTGISSIDNAITLFDINSAYDIAISGMKSVARIPLYDQQLLFASGEPWNPHNIYYIQIGLKMPDGSNISGVSNVKAILTHDGKKYAGGCDFARISGQVFITFSTFTAGTTTASSYTVLITFTKDYVVYGIEFKVVNGARPTIL